MFEIDWRKVITEPAEKKVFEALENPKWEWRTIDALSRASGLSEEAVRRVLRAHPGLVRRSSIPAPGGKDLYTLQRRYLERRGLLDKIRVSLSANSSTSSSSSEDPS